MPSEDSSVLKARGLTKRYGRRRALTDCHLDIPKGRVIGLVGPNGAGKSTLLQLACGLSSPTSGDISVLGSRPAANPAHLAKVGFVAQDTPVYSGLTVTEHLRLGARLNPGWDPALASKRIAQVGLDPRARAGRLSGGQRAQLALTLAAAKRPELLIFDEPAAALDPLARAGFLENLMEFVAELGASAVLSSHLLSDVERVCDYLVVLCDSRIQVAGEVGDLLAGHHRLVAPVGELDRVSERLEIIHADDVGQNTSMIVRADVLPPDVPWAVEDVTLEKLVLGYMSRSIGTPARATAREVLR